MQKDSISKDLPDFQCPSNNPGARFHKYVVSGHSSQQILSRTPLFLNL